MTVSDYQKLVEWFKKIPSLPQKDTENFIELSWNYALDNQAPGYFSDMIEILLSAVEETDFLLYIADAKINSDEAALAKMIGLLPARLCEPLLEIVQENTAEDGGINFNKVLLVYVETQNRDTTQDYEQKFKSILRCLNNEMRRKDEEIYRLRDLFTDQPDPVRILDQIKGPLTEFEIYIANAISKNKDDAHRLIQIDEELRQSLQHSFNIFPCVSPEQWKSQEKVPFDPGIHQPPLKSDEMTEELTVTVLSPGFILRKDGEADAVIRGTVCPAETRKSGKRGKSGGKSGGDTHQKEKQTDTADKPEGETK